MKIDKTGAVVILVLLFLGDLLVPFFPVAATLLLIGIFYEPARKNMISVLQALSEESK